MSRAKSKPAPLAVLPEMDRPGPEWDRVRNVDSAANDILREAAVLYQAVRSFECYAAPEGDAQQAHVRELLARTAKALADIVVDCGDLQVIIRRAAKAVPS